MSPGSTTTVLAMISAPTLVGKIEDTDVLAGRQIVPEVNVERGSGRALEDGARHSDDNKPRFFCAERVNKPSE